jgi:hypothetical protein
MRAGFVLGIGRKLVLHEEDDEDDELKDLSVRLFNFVAYTDPVARISKTLAKPHTSS